MPELHEVVSACSRNYQRDLSGVLDALKITPLSDRLNCVADEVFAVCVGDWLYYIDRRTAKLERVSDWRTLLFILRNYMSDLVKLVKNKKFLDEAAKFLAKIHSPLVLHRRRVDGELIIGGALVKFDEVVVFSDDPCTAYLINNGAVVASVDVSKCSAFDKMCASFLATYGDVIIEAVREFDSRVGRQTA